LTSFATFFEIAPAFSAQLFPTVKPLNLPVIERAQLSRENLAGMSSLASAARPVGAIAARRSNGPAGARIAPHSRRGKVAWMENSVQSWGLAVGLEKVT
jgi:hypothetical protein